MSSRKLDAAAGANTTGGLRGVIAGNNQRKEKHRENDNKREIKGNFNASSF